MLELLGKLSEKTERAKVSKQLAKKIGAEEIIIFIKDTELNVLLPAPGFPQTLQEASVWQAFLKKCIKQKFFRSKLPFPQKTIQTDATGIAYNDSCVMVLLGGKPDSEKLTSLSSVLPLLSSVLQHDQYEIDTKAQLSLTEKSITENQEMVKKLDDVRREFQSVLMRAEKEIESRKKAEEEASAHRKRLYDLFMQAPAYVTLYHGPDHIIELSNPLTRKLLGDRDLIGKPIREAMPELSNQGIFEILDSVYASGKPFIGTELSVMLDKNEDGNLEQGYFNTVIQATYDSNGQIDGVMAHSVEVTEQVQARKRVEEGEKRFRTMANSIQNLAWMANPDGWIFWYNQRWFDYTGTNLEEMQGWGWQKVHHPDHIKRITAFAQEAWKKGESWELTFPLRGTDGKYRWFLTRADVVRDAQGKVVRWIGTNTDIDDQKRALEQKDEFIGVASHELKTPVTSIKAYTQVLQARFRKADDMKSAELAGKMDGQLNKLTNLIADLLDSTKIDAGKLQFHEDYFDFNELVNEIVGEIQITTEKHTILKELTKTKSVYGDRDRIGQVLTNLLTNAIKYSPNVKKIVVHTSFDTENVTLCVQDFGVGISKEKQDKVFERFYRVSGPKQDTYPGLGLGLYISSEIIKRLGGRIWVESIKGKGSTFCFRLPIKKRMLK